VIVQVFCQGGQCPEVQMGDTVEADGEQHGVGDPDRYFVASGSFEVTRNGRRVT
jgi:hypothetical protein